MRRTKFKEYLTRQNYSNIIYLLLKKEWTHFGEVRKMFKIFKNQHLKILENDNIVQSRKPNDNEKNYLLLLNRTIPKYRLEEEMIYELTQEALNFYTQPKIYDILQIMSYEGIDDYIILQKHEYEKKLYELKERERFEEQRYVNELKRLGIYQEQMIKQKTKEFYENGDNIPRQDK